MRESIYAQKMTFPFLSIFNHQTKSKQVCAQQSDVHSVRFKNLQNVSETYKKKNDVKCHIFFFFSFYSNNV